MIKKVGEDGITIECISARLLKARKLIKSNFVTFVVAYAPTEEALEGQKAKCFIGEPWVFTVECAYDINKAE